MRTRLAAAIVLLLTLAFLQPPRPARAAAPECRDAPNHPEWIFCDDFEDGSALQRPGRYFEYGNLQNGFTLAEGVGVQGSSGMRVHWQPGQVEAGNLKVAFGRNPNSYMNASRIRATEDFREIFYRMYLRMQPGWQGSPAKLSRATIFTSGDTWAQAMVAHLWSDDRAHLLLDPAGCIDAQSRVKCSTYNDFDNFTWLGNLSGKTPLFAPDHAGRWYCVEAHVRLNDPGQANGIHEFWIDNQLEARRAGLDFVHSYTAYGLNAVFFENYWNAGSPKTQERYFDNIVISTAPVGCLTGVESAPTVYLPSLLRQTAH